MGRSGIFHDGRVPNFKTALRWAMKGMALADWEVLARKSPAQNLNTAMISLVEALHCQTAYTYQMVN